MSVSVILPTKRGRERVLQVTLEAYGRTAPDAELVMPENYDTVGEAWNAGAKRAKGDLLVFTTDDCIPHDGWLEVVLSTWAADPDGEVGPDWYQDRWYPRGLVAAPVLLYPNGQVEAYGSMGGGMKIPAGHDGMRVRTSGVLAMHRDIWDDVGVFADIHYYVDDDWCWRAELAGYQVRVCDGWRLTHAHQADAGVIGAAQLHRAAFLERVGAGLPR